MEQVTIHIGEAAISVPAEAAARAYLAQIIPGTFSAALTSLDTPDAPPPIGCRWHGGIYAGIARGTEGQNDHYLIVGTAFEGTANWQAAMDWAKSLPDGCWHLPTRKEQALCFANVPELFEKEAYWSAEPHADDDASAWGQGFHNGRQNYWHKDYELRARAVRRVML